MDAAAAAEGPVALTSWACGSSRNPASVSSSCRRGPRAVGCCWDLEGQGWDLSTETPRHDSQCYVVSFYVFVIVVVVVVVVMVIIYASVSRPHSCTTPWW